MKNQYGARLVYQNAINALMAAGYSNAQIQNAVLSQSVLRLEQPIDLTKTTFYFPLLNNETTSGSPIRATETRLAQQDMFYVSEIGFYLNKASSTTATNGLDVTYPSPVTFPNGAATLETVYNAFLSLAINNSVIIPKMDVKRFKITPRTQLTAATNSPLDQFSGAGDDSAQNVIEPNILLYGTKNNVLTLTLPGAVGGTADNYTYLVIEIRGILAQNVTIIA
jgi:hypothetical protein